MARPVLVVHAEALLGEVLAEAGLAVRQAPRLGLAQPLLQTKAAVSTEAKASSDASPLICWRLTVPALLVEAMEALLTWLALLPGRSGELLGERRPGSADDIPAERAASTSVAVSVSGSGEGSSFRPRSGEEFGPVPRPRSGTDSGPALVPRSGEKGLWPDSEESRTGDEEVLGTGVTT